MPPPTHSRAQNVWGWTIEELALILLRQFRRLLSEHGIDISDSQLRLVAGRAANKTIGPEDKGVALRLSSIIAESEKLLAGLGLTFEQSLNTEMTELPNWDTTADFLTLANEKVNAELRITAGSALLLLLGDAAYAHYLLTSVKHGTADPEDVDAVIAMRALAHAADIDPLAHDAVYQLATWIESQITQ